MFYYSIYSLASKPCCNPKSQPIGRLHSLAPSSLGGAGSPKQPKVIPKLCSDKQCPMVLWKMAELYLLTIYINYMLTICLENGLTWLDCVLENSKEHWLLGFNLWVSGAWFLAPKNRNRAATQHGTLEAVELQSWISFESNDSYPFSSG